MNKYIFDRKELKRLAKININVKAALILVLLVSVIPYWVNAFGWFSSSEISYIDGILYETTKGGFLSSLLTTVLPLALGYWATSYFMYVHVSSGETMDSVSFFKKTDINLYPMYIAKVVVANIFMVLWGLLLVVPGVIKAYSYALVPYIAVTKPELGIMETIKESSRLMNGYKFDTFIMDLSFLGWDIVNSFAFGIIGFWLIPYKRLARTGLYFELANRDRDFTKDDTDDDFIYNLNNN